MASNRGDRFAAVLLVVYLLAVASVATLNLVASFEFSSPQVPAGQTPTPAPACERAVLFVCNVRSAEARLLTQAFLGGMVGSFLHAAQSLTSYVGNGEFKLSWTSWYVLRPWIGGVLGLAMAFVARAGLIGPSDGGSVNVYGMVALGLLGGWFSKTTTDKLQEVFSTLFKTDADTERKDKLKVDQPSISAVNPKTVPVTASDITITGKGFVTGAGVTINTTPVQTTFVSATELKVSLATLTPRPVGDAQVVVKNPSGAKPDSDTFTLKFE